MGEVRRRSGQSTHRPAFDSARKATDKDYKVKRPPSKDFHSVYIAPCVEIEQLDSHASLPSYDYATFKNGRHAGLKLKSVLSFILLT